MSNKHFTRSNRLENLGTNLNKYHAGKVDFSLFRSNKKKTKKNLI
jgi:hypothetical protein